MDEWEDYYRTAEANRRRDRLSELPDPLIHAILSLLDIRDVVRTNILSKRWKNLWSTIPCLCLDFSEFEQTLTFQCIISNVLSQWKGSKILKFCLSFDSFIAGPSNVIHSWLLFAIEKQVEELFLDLSNWRHGYCLPQPLYSCSSITKLTLEDCRLRIEETVQWNQLKILKLIYLDGLNGDAMNKILLGAPRLEELVLKTSKIGENENFNIRSTSLKMLEIDSYYLWPETAVLRIWAPNLLTLKIYAGFDSTCSLEVPSLTHAILCLLHEGDVAAQFEMFNHVFESIRHVEKVTLLDSSIEMLVKFKNKDMVMPLLNSKILELYYGDGKVLDFVGMMFPKLERLIVDQQQRRQGMCFIHGEETHIAMVDACNSLASAKMTFPTPSLLHLKIFEATWSMRDPSIILVIQIVLENAPILEKMVIRLRQHRSDVETFILAQEKVMSMPRCSPTAQVIISLFD